MANAYTNAVTLAEIDEILRVSYLTDDFVLQTRPRLGLAAFIKMDTKQVKGKQTFYQVETEPYTGTRTGSPETVLGTPRYVGGRLVTINLIEDAGLGITSDLIRFNAPIQISEELRRLASGDGSVVEYADRLATEVRADFTEARARKLWQNKNGRMFDLAGSPLGFNAAGAEDFTDIGALGNADTTFLSAIASGSISMALKGMKVEIYDGVTMLFGAAGTIINSVCTIADVFRYDVSGDGTMQWAVMFDLDGTDAVTTAAQIQAGRSVYLDGEKGYGLYGFPTWFDLDAAGGADSIFGIDRTTTGNRWFLAPTEGPSAVTALSLRNHIDKMFPILAREGGKNPYVLAADLELLETAIAAMNSERRHIVEANTKNNQLTAQYGFDGLVLHSPYLGPIALQADAHIPPNELYFIKPSSWGMVNAGGVEWIPGDNGMWLNMHDEAVRYPVYRADLFFMSQMYCKKPRANLRVANVSSTSYSGEGS